MEQGNDGDFSRGASGWGQPDWNNSSWVSGHFNRENALRAEADYKASQAIQENTHKRVVENLRPPVPAAAKYGLPAAARFKLPTNEVAIPGPRRSFWNRVAGLFRASILVTFAIGFISGVIDNARDEVYNPLQSAGILWRAWTVKEAAPPLPKTQDRVEWTLDKALVIVGGFYKCVGSGSAVAGNAVSDVVRGGIWVFRKL